VARSTTCLLCDAELEALPDGLQKHPEVGDCDVRLTDAWGVAVPVPETNGVEHDPPQTIDIKMFPLVDEVLDAIFGERGLRRLGGMSSGKGWSMFTTYQRCPYLYQQKYLRDRKPPMFVESPSLAIGTLVHVFLAVFYARMVIGDYPFTPEEICDRTKAKANPEFVDEAWRVFSAYRAFYSIEKILPLAIEYDLRDPRTGESCRFDLIAYFEESIAGRPPGTYVMEHKTASRFDQDTLEGWVVDGEVLGQVALWERLGLDLRFGKLRGVIVNLLGKHKVPQFHRTLVAPESWQIKSHLDDLKRWEGLIQLSKSTGSFPRARTGCIGRYGRCSFFDSCATGEE